ncbi:cytochrome c oxidase subunit 6A2, mitochondrial-like [Toxorhynchites rutilus septentrionalis]|uniref:cytochrome c oxidase subunit 6A2, mitochondrial-like n=1 Tax=Toxorhynchites rutilus septentrionalis TaxID=329112 RepID=UPI002479EF81|nr:cytochrome c oxidase subunit 6A2, mitochondrial-like [Toxorhynchites rutilus septentrionalis]
MSLVNHILRRAISQTTARNSAAASSSADTAQKGGGGRKLFMMLSLFVAFPAVGLCMVNAYLQPDDHERPEFVPYEHMRIRTKRFPWGEGTKSLFHNPRTNALPTGYED